MYRTVYSGQFAPQAPDGYGPTSLWIVYHDAKIYGLACYYSGPDLNTVLETGTIIMKNVSPNYSNVFFDNPEYDWATKTGTLPEDTVVQAGYFADFTTYHTTL